MAAQATTRGGPTELGGGWSGWAWEDGGRVHGKNTGMGGLVFEGLGAWLVLIIGLRCFGLVRLEAPVLLDAITYFGQ